MNSLEIINQLLNENELIREIVRTMNRMIESLDEIKEKFIEFMNECNCNVTHKQVINELIIKNNELKEENDFENNFNKINDYLNKLKTINNSINSEIINNKSETKITINNYINNNNNKRKLKRKKRKIKDIVDENIEELDENEILANKTKLESKRGRPRKEEWPRIEREKQSRACYVCSWPSCDKRFLFNSHLRNHFRTHTGEKPYECEWPGCGKQFHTNAVLQNHLKSYHEKRFQIKNKTYKCLYPECEARYQRRDQLERHTSAVHTGEKPLRCDWPGCDFETVYKNKLKSHKWRHTGDKPFKCNWPSCEWTFRQAHHLKTHMLKHSGEKPFSCDWPGCDRRFQSKQALRIHNEKTHSCHQLNDSIVENNE